MSEPETFSQEQIAKAISDFLEYGEQTYSPDSDAGHKGAFSGNGWPARCLRYHLSQMEKTK